MTSLYIELPESTLKAAQELAEHDAITVDQFIAMAVAEKISALTTLDFVAKRLERDPREVLLEILAKVPKVEPEAYDRA